MTATGGVPAITLSPSTATPAPGTKAGFSAQAITPPTTPPGSSTRGRTGSTEDEVMDEDDVETMNAFRVQKLLILQQLLEAEAEPKEGDDYGAVAVSDAGDEGGGAVEAQEEEEVLEGIEEAEDEHPDEAEEEVHDEAMVVAEAIRDEAIGGDITAPVDDMKDSTDARALEETNNPVQGDVVEDMTRGNVDDDRPESEDGFKAEQYHQEEAGSTPVDDQNDLVEPSEHERDIHSSTSNPVAITESFYEMLLDNEPETPCDDADVVAEDVGNFDDVGDDEEIQVEFDIDGYFDETEILDMNDFQQGPESSTEAPELKQKTRRRYSVMTVNHLIADLELCITELNTSGNLPAARGPAELQDVLADYSADRPVTPTTDGANTSTTAAPAVATAAAKVDGQAGIVRMLPDGRVVRLKASRILRKPSIGEGFKNDLSRNASVTYVDVAPPTTSNLAAAAPAEVSVLGEDDPRQNVPLKPYRVDSTPSSPDGKVFKKVTVTAPAKALKLMGLVNNAALANASVGTLPQATLQSAPTLSSLVRKPSTGKKLKRGQTAPSMGSISLSVGIKAKKPAEEPVSAVNGLAKEAKDVRTARGRAAAEPIPAMDALWLSPAPEMIPELPEDDTAGTQPPTASTVAAGRVATVPAKERKGRGTRMSAKPLGKTAPTMGSISLSVGINDRPSAAARREDGSGPLSPGAEDDHGTESSRDTGSRAAAAARDRSRSRDRFRLKRWDGDGASGAGTGSFGRPSVDAARPSMDGPRPSIQSDWNADAASSDAGRSRIRGETVVTVQSLLAREDAGLISGSLMKFSSRSMFKTWKRRYFILMPSQGRLYYFRNPDSMERSIGWMSFSSKSDAGSSAVFSYKGRPSIQLTLNKEKPDGEQWYLVAADEMDKDRWMRGILKVIMLAQNPSIAANPQYSSLDSATIYDEMDSDGRRPSLSNSLSPPGPRNDSLPPPTPPTFPPHAGLPYYATPMAAVSPYGVAGSAGHIVDPTTLLILDSQLRAAQMQQQQILAAQQVLYAKAASTPSVTSTDNTTNNGSSVHRANDFELGIKYLRSYSLPHQEEPVETYHQPPVHMSSYSSLSNPSGADRFNAGMNNVASTLNEELPLQTRLQANVIPTARTSSINAVAQHLAAAGYNSLPRARTVGGRSGSDNGGELSGGPPRSISILPSNSGPHLSATLPRQPTTPPEFDPPLRAPLPQGYYHQQGAHRGPVVSAQYAHGLNLRRNVSDDTMSTMTGFEGRNSIGGYAMGGGGGVDRKAELKSQVSFFNALQLPLREENG
ncbi:hypothetical protein HK101_006876 [Irineochytrium annulatum]|nr:hypothetical protein HK101_006876 [Irineochytrium annulatum]